MPLAWSAGCQGPRRPQPDWLPHGQRRSSAGDSHPTGFRAVAACAAVGRARNFAPGFPCGRIVVRWVGGTCPAGEGSGIPGSASVLCPPIRTRCPPHEHGSPLPPRGPRRQAAQSGGRQRRYRASHLRRPRADGADQGQARPAQIPGADGRAGGRDHRRDRAGGGRSEEVHLCVGDGPVSGERRRCSGDEGPRPSAGRAGRG